MLFFIQMNVFLQVLSIIHIHYHTLLEDLLATDDADSLGIVGTLSEEVVLCLLGSNCLYVLDCYGIRINDECWTETTTAVSSTESYLFVAKEVNYVVLSYMCQVLFVHKFDNFY